MFMKRMIIAAVLLTGLAAAAMAQDIDRFFDNAKVRKELNLTDKEVLDLQKVWDDSQKSIQVANADRDVKASELKRLLLESPVNMNAVQKSLRDAMDIEYKIRLAQIERVVKAREILGEKRWADVQRYIRGLTMRMRQNRDERGPDGNGPDRPNRPRNMMPPRNTPPKDK
jgi:hypothetical protein